MGKPCLMLSLPFKDSSFWDFVKSLSPELIHEEGVENYNHTTVLYGIDDPANSLVTIARLINTMHPFTIELGKISFFRTNPEFDVMKVEIKSLGLRLLNDLVRKLVPYTNDYPEYIPHFTIAYVKKGAFKDLEGSSYFEGMLFSPDKAVFSFGDHVTATIPFYNSKEIYE